ncbi:hypothetical protein MYXO_00019 [Myxococcaceae bacterium]|nr:hypothetical protein MYXO_00019 [Myxococcaceae bacterium]
MTPRTPTRLRPVLVGALVLGMAALATGQEPSERSPASPPAGRAPRPHGSKPPPFEDLLERHSERLGLDDATLVKIRSLRDATHATTEELESELRHLRGELRKLLDSDTPALDDVLAKADAVGSAETALHKARLRTMLEIRALLSAEQRAELVEIHEEMRRERGHGRPPGPPPDDFGGPPPGSLGTPPAPPAPALR